MSRGILVTEMRRLVSNHVIAVFWGSLLFACIACKGSDTTLRWKAQFEWHKGDATRLYGWEPTLDAIQKETKDLLVIEFFEPNALVPNKGMLRAVSTGAIDLALAGASRHAIIPEGLGLVTQGLPMAWSNPQDAYQIYYEGGLLELLQQMYAEQFNVKFFPAGGSGRYGLSTAFPLSGLSDMQGKKIRASSTYASIVEALGATPTYIPGAELYMGLKLGTVDGMVYSYNGFVSQKFGEVLTHVVLPALVTPPIGVFWINMDSWQALPTDLQERIARRIRDDFVPSTQASMAQDDEVISQSGMKVVELSDAEIKRLRELCLAGWEEIAAKGPLAGKAIQILKDYHKIQASSGSER